MTEEYTESEIQTARLQTDAKVSLLKRRTKYYGISEGEIDAESIFQNILRLNRNQLPKLCKLGATRNTMTATDIANQVRKSQIADHQIAKAYLLEKQEESARRVAAKEDILQKILDIETQLLCQDGNQPLDIYLERLVEKIKNVFDKIYDSPLLEIDQSVLIRRIKNANISYLENWMHSLEYNVLERSAELQRIDTLVDELSILMEIPLEFQIKMNTEDDEAYCRQLIADDTATQQMAWEEEDVFRFPN
jgi:hypothetical protein